MSMTRSTAALGLALMLAASACQSSQTSSADWSYQGNTGPDHWGELKPEWTLAATGRRQSPIDVDVDRAVPAQVDAIRFDHEPTTLEVLNNGHTVQDNYHAGGRITVGGHEYKLAQFHFHSPSEHTLDGEHFPMEMHLVHRDADGKLAVVAVMIAQGEENPEFARFGRHVPREPGRADKVEGMHVDATDLLPADQANFRYSGSLTTPPCSEDVAWFLMRQPIEASRRQIDEFRKVYYGNNRPTQPLNGRTITASR
jgi:carbonic anhydrase